MPGMDPRVPTSSAIPDHESASLMSSDEPDADEPEGGEAEPEMKVDSVTIRPAENGGFIVTCAKSGKSASGNGPSNSPKFSSKDYAFSTFDEAAQYVAQELGQGQATAPAVPAPAPAAPMPPAAMSGATLPSAEPRMR